MLDDKSNDRDTENDDDLTDSLSRLFEVNAENFPYPVLLARADVGETLQLLPHPDKDTLLVFYREQVAGYISLHDHAGLVERAWNGERYEAVISENYGGRCRVIVRRVN